MSKTFMAQANQFIEKSNVELEPDLMSAAEVRKLLKEYSRAEKLVAYGVASLARRLDAEEVAKATGTSAGKAKAVVRTGEVMAGCDDLSLAMQTGRVSMDQAAEIASAEDSAPGSAKGLLTVVERESFQVFREKARKAKLEAEQHRDLGRRQLEARTARSYFDELGMVNIHLRLQPHVGTPIVARAEAGAQRLAKKVAKNDRESFERYLADAYASLLGGKGSGRARRPELVVLVDHEVAKRGWGDVEKGEVCKIPGVGPVPPAVAKEIAADAFLNGVFYDGTDLRHFKRWTRHIPIEVQVALELGDPPDFDGVACIDCGKRFRTEFDHVEPRIAGGPTSNPNLDGRCWSCHQTKTEDDRKAGKLKPKET